MLEIDPRRTDLAAEFKARPFGPHSPDLQHVLNLMRATPLAGRHVLVVVKRKREWALGTLSGERGRPVEILPGYRFTDPAEGEWAVFKLRWQALTGAALTDEPGR
jgi:hypothetical protein